MISVTRKYLTDLDKLSEILDNMPYIDNDANKFYIDLTTKVENEYKRLYDLLLINENKRRRRK